MKHDSPHDGKTVKNKKPVEDSPTVVDFGERTISDQNFSKVCVLPKTALSNCGIDQNMKVNVKLVQDKGERYIKLTPVCEIKQKESVKKDE